MPSTFTAHLRPVNWIRGRSELNVILLDDKGDTYKMKASDYFYCLFRTPEPYGALTGAFEYGRGGGKHLIHPAGKLVAPGPIPSGGPTIEPPVDNPVPGVPETMPGQGKDWYTE